MRPMRICARSKLSSVNPVTLWRQPWRHYADYKRPSTAPKPQIDIKHIRENAELHAENCRLRNYQEQSHFPARINEYFSQWQELQRNNRSLRERANHLKRQISSLPSSPQDNALGETQSHSRQEWLGEAKEIKQQLAVIENDENRLLAEMQSMAFAIPNLTGAEAPIGSEPQVLSFINEELLPQAISTEKTWRSHVDIGTELGILDFASAGSTSGWGWYYLVDEAAQLEQALIQYAITVATRYNWRQVAPPSMVYSHIATACGYQPRDQNNEQQIYAVAQNSDDIDRGKPELSLAGTSEIPLAGMKANTTIDVSQLPLKHVAVSRCYRAEAGARGASTKGLYRVHEFTKVELFAWTSPAMEEATDVFDEIVDMQTEILQTLGLGCRVLEMPTEELGASASRKIDIEAFFPSRIQQRGGWGEVTSTSICTDYQTRRLATRTKIDGRLAYPWTLNGTALAVPRILAAILENGWNEEERTVLIPECLRPWMNGQTKIGVPRSRDHKN